MQSQIENYPDISFIGDLSLSDYQELGKTFYTEKFYELTGETVELHDTDEEKILLDTIAYQFYSVLLYMDNAAKMNLLKYSEGDFLDNLAARHGITRTEAQPASVTMRFTLSEIQNEDYTIPEGTQVAPAEAEDIYFATTSDTIIPTGQEYIDVVCECTTAGEDGNGFLPGQIAELVDTIPYIETVVNLTTSDGGTDIEDDDSFAERVYLSPSTYSTAGTEDSYAYHAKSASSLVNDVVVYSPAPCQVEVIITSKNGGVPSDELINIVYNYLMDAQRKVLTDQITVKAPATKEFDIDMTYYIDITNQKYAENIQEQVEAAVSNYITWQTERIGRDIAPSKLIQLVMEAGAKRVEVTSPKHIKVDNSEIAVLSNRAVTYGGIEDE